VTSVARTRVGTTHNAYCGVHDVVTVPLILTVPPNTNVVIEVDEAARATIV
jgi:hypothetical protein